MKTLIIFLFTIATLLSITSCIDEIDFDVDSDNRYVIIDGSASDIHDTYEVKLTLSPDIGVGNDNIFTPITGATVILRGNDGSEATYIESQEEGKEGIYEAFLELKDDVEYVIDISLPDGRKILSKAQSLPAGSSTIDSLDFTVVEEASINASGNVSVEQFVEVYLTSQFENDDQFIRWRVGGEYEFVEDYPMALNPRKCFIKENIDINNLSIIRSKDFANNRVQQYQIIRTAFNDRFTLQYMFDIKQLNINQDEYEYWLTIQELINTDGTLFDPPPGVVIGNMSFTTDEPLPVQGYFSLSRSTRKRYFVKTAEKNFFFPTRCTGLTFRVNPPKCADCLIINGSSLERPPYWQF